MKQLVEVIAKALVDNPDEVVVTETQKDKAIVVNLKVASSDIGKVIGKSGRIAKSIRAVVSAAASICSKTPDAYSIILILVHRFQNNVLENMFDIC